MKRKDVLRNRSMTVLRVAALIVSLLLCGVLESRATTYYVATNGTGNGDSWVAATNSIQGAIDRTGPGDTVLVSNGVYEAGGRTAGGSALTNRVVITNAITVQSANNTPATTIIKGAKDPSATNGPAAVRCVWMSAGLLSGFTLTNGATFATGSTADYKGGGVYCDLTTTPIVSNCLITGNSAGTSGDGNIGMGGGTFCGTVSFCAIIGNTAVGGGGGTACGTQGGYPVNNSTISGNSASWGGGVYGSDLNNCLVAGNSSTKHGGGGWSVGNLNNCTVVSNSCAGASGIGGIEAFLLARNCIVYFNAGWKANYYNGVAYGAFSNSCTTPAPSGINDAGGNISADPLFVNAAGGNYRPAGNSPCVDKGTNEYTGTVDLDGKTRIQNGRVDMGAYEYGGTTYYVAINGTGNGDSWTTATNNIQGAIDRAYTLDIILVSNGTYEVGGRTAGGGVLTNRVVITNDIAVRSANNTPATTIIKGAQDPSTTNGPAAVRCIWMSAGSLIGFTVTNGATLASGGAVADQKGGGVYCNLTAVPIISNCVIAGNSAGGGAAGGYGDGNQGIGGGTFCGNVNNCTIVGNTAVGGGGGTACGTQGGYPVNNSMIISNSAGWGGGVYGSDLNNCLVAGNTSVLHGGGGWSVGNLNNCTVVSNSCAGGTGVGGIEAFLLARNCVVYLNAGWKSNYYDGVAYGAFSKSCTTPAPSGINDAGGNISADPQFVNTAGGNYRLKVNSPCMNTGTNVSTGTVDLDGLMRIRYGTVDMGAYEFIRSGAVFGFR